ITEAFKLRDKDYRLLGIGSYMSEAVKQGRADAQVWAIVAMILMIVALDQLLWRPVVAWAQKFRVEEGGSQEEASSWFLDWLRRSRIAHLLHTWRERRRGQQVLRRVRPARAAADPLHPSPWARVVSLGLFVLLMATLIWGAWKLFELLREVSAEKW